MLPQESFRTTIRRATSSCHERVDRVFSQFDLADRQEYGCFLIAQAEAHIAAEAALDRADAASFLPDWPRRRRAALLRSDLDAMGLPAPAGDQAIAFDGAASVLGGVYVLEGSRLGGRLLRRSVPPEFGCSFLDAADPAGWRALVALLEHRLTTEPERDAAIDAAIRVFGLFEESGRRHLVART